MNLISGIFLFVIVFNVWCIKFELVILLIFCGYCIVKKSFVWVCLFIFNFNKFVLFSNVFFCVILYLGWFINVEVKVDLFVLFGFMIVCILFVFIVKLIFFKIFLFLMDMCKLLIVNVDIIFFFYKLIFI